MFIEVSIVPKSTRSNAEMREVFLRLLRWSGSASIGLDAESAQAILRGESEEHLEALITHCERELGIELEVGAPHVSYRETLTRAVTVKYTHKRQMGGSGEFAEVTIAFEPLPRGSGFVFENEIVGGAIPKEFIPSVEMGLEAQKESGLLAGFPLIDFRARLIDGKYHEVDSNARTFEIAARAAFRELAAKGVAEILEPIMKVEVLTPDDYLGGVIGDFNARRGQVCGADARGNMQLVTALVPLACMFGYRNTLRGMTQSRAQFLMQFDHYEPVPSADDDPNTFPPAVGMRA